ncbi:MAG TPA: aminotransferase class V-fold PLP-dependent enzyme, partial [Afipia sp.]
MSTPDFPSATHPGGASLDMLQGGVPQSGQLEQSAAALAGAPDPAVIARMANALFSGVPANPATSPGAALPSAPAFAVEPLYRAIPGTPAANPPLMPNNNPGSSAVPFPTAGAALPSAPVFAADPRYASAAPAAPQTPSDLPRELDLAALPSRLDGALSFVPDLDKSAHPFGNQSAPVAAVPGSSSYYFLEASPAVSNPDEAARVTPFPLDVQTLDLGSLAPQHRAEIDAKDISGARAFDPHVFRRDFPILDQHVNGRPLIWLDNGATTQKPQSVIDRISRFYSYENSNIHRAAHTLAARSTDAYEAAREKVRAFINAPSVKDIIFVRGATEGINLVAQAWGRRNIGKDDEIVVSHLEHHANIVPWQMLCL